MSTGADAMGVAAWLTPALIVAVAAGLAHPAVGQPADPAPLATPAPVELIDPDCDPAEAEKADPLLVEDPDGVCPPDAAERPAESDPRRDRAPGTETASRARGPAPTRPGAGPRSAEQASR